MRTERQGVNPWWVSLLAVACLVGDHPAFAGVVIWVD
jgi:hypothetical protein